MSKTIIVSNCIGKLQDALTDSNRFENVIIQETYKLVDFISNLRNYDCALCILGNCNGIDQQVELIDIIRVISPHSRIIGVYKDEEELIRLIKEGIDYWIHEESSIQLGEEIVVFSLMNSSKKQSAQFKDQGFVPINDSIHVNFHTHRCFYNDQEILLTPNENTIVKALYEAEGQIVSREDLYETLKKLDNKHYPVGKARVIDVHVRNLRYRLGYDVIRTVRNEGYYLNVDNI
ncbi:winged helix-turn-helix transcriptional regulator [Erysipelothrix sp. HDW6A]|uniref:winged helix-turn-helix domain-containing protein n=1 Tax=Erysipelothrix sp. HDW6A TaxID=2714928 RepID=UPI00140A8E91|nr:winged helix-turn-helix domain-containing protein [Erysipelothrix sp. HDW6A]QIK56907.1 winged helix-turn-helix transcriptional regulator [Erysipelothrix sp. HDW6A]